GYTINFSNPASFSSFATQQEAKSKKIAWGRAVLDLGLNFEDHTIVEPSTNKKFTPSNALFSYVQVGVPLQKNWGMSFGLRPVSRISYNLFHGERLYDPNTGVNIDSSVTTFTGDGGLYAASIGTGIKFGNFSIGVNANYLFGKKD